MWLNLVLCACNVVFICSRVATLVHGLGCWTFRGCSLRKIRMLIRQLLLRVELRFIRIVDKHLLEHLQTRDLTSLRASFFFLLLVKDEFTGSSGGGRRLSPLLLHFRWSTVFTGLRCARRLVVVVVGGGRAMQFQTSVLGLNAILGRRAWQRWFFGWARAVMQQSWVLLCSLGAASY